MPDLPPRPVLDGTAEIDAALYKAWDFCKRAAAETAEHLRVAEELMRDQAGDAKYLAVNGETVAVRIIQDVIDASFRKDFYRKTGKTDA